MDPWGTPDRTGFVDEEFLIRYNLYCYGYFLMMSNHV